MMTFLLYVIFIGGGLIVYLGIRRTLQEVI